MKISFTDGLLIITVVVAYTVLTSLLGFYWAIHPPLRVITPITPKNFQLPYENVSFYTQDKVLIHGWFIPNKNPHAKTIILLHGYPADKGNILPSRYFLHQNYNLLFIDFRYFGASSGIYTTAGKDEVLDLLAAIHYLQQRGIQEVGVWGYSMGGSVALLAAKKSHAIKAIVAEASYARLDMMLQEYYPFPLVKYPLIALTRLWGLLFEELNTHNQAIVQAFFDKYLK